MRLTNPILLALAFVTVTACAGCAAPAASTRGADSAVRQEPRRMSYVLGLRDDGAAMNPYGERKVH
jgi:hypothetical protein